MDDLDNILNEEQPVEAVEAAQEPVEQQGEQEVAEATEGQPRGPDGKFAPKGTKEADAMPAPEDTAKQIPFQSYQAEKQKRQELEQQLEALRQEMQQPKQPPAPPPSIWEDDQAALNHVRNDAVSEAVQQATFNAKLDMSEMMARQAHTDFDEMKADFIRMMQENPALQQQALADPHPWQKAYQIAKNARTMNELGATNIDELKAKLLEQIKAEQAEAAQPQIAIPRSLADAQSSKGDNTPPVTNALTLEEILGS